MDSDQKWQYDLYRIIACVTSWFVTTQMTEWPRVREIANETKLSQRRVMEIVEGESCLTENVAYSNGAGFACLPKAEWIIEFNPWT